MKKVTTALRETIKETNPDLPKQNVYSDGRGKVNKTYTRVAIKVVGLEKKINMTQLNNIRMVMQQKGYVEYKKPTISCMGFRWYKGVRFYYEQVK